MNCMLNLSGAGVGEAYVEYHILLPVSIKAMHVDIYATHALGNQSRTRPVNLFVRYDPNHPPRANHEGGYCFHRN